MKRLMSLMLVLLALLGAAYAQGEEERRAATWRDAALWSAPLKGAQELMHYCGGTRVEVVRDAGAGYVQVNVGDAGGGLMGYMEKRFLVFGEESIRKIYPERRVYPAQGFTLYSYCDTRSDALFESRASQVYAIGENEEWVHAAVTVDDAQITGFVSRAEAGLDGEMSWMTSASMIPTTLLPGEITREEAVAFARQAILADGQMANGQQGVPVTGEMLDGCRVQVDVQWDIDRYYAGAMSDEQAKALGVKKPEQEPALFIQVTFFYTDRTWEDGFPMICALACLYVNGDEVVAYDFGKG